VRASSTKSIQYFFKAFNLFSASLDVTFSQFLNFSITFKMSSYFTFKVENMLFILSFQAFKIAKIRCSSVINSSEFLSAIISASLKILFKL
jgi:hypothetical protein